MFPLECVCENAGRCEATGGHMSAATHARCQADARYRHLLSGRPRTEWPAELQPVPKPAKRTRTARPTRKSIPLPVCRFLVPGTESSYDPTGAHNSCGKCHVHECEIHGTCTTGKAFEGTACCATCNDRRREWTRHLIYFVYPVAGNGLWQRNLDQLFERIELFNGTRTIAISTGCKLRALDSPEAVEEYIAGRAETIRVPAVGNLGEVTAFVPLWERLQQYDGPEHCTFYAHTKGVTKPVNDGISVHRWADLMYAANLDHWEDVAETLEKKPIVGSFKKDGPCFRRRADWHYTGTFYWCRNADVFARNWRKVWKRYGGTELWPGQTFRSHEAGCLFYGGVGYSLYSVSEIERAERCYRAWPWSDRDGVSVRPQLRRIVDDAIATADPAPVAKSGDGIVMLGGGRYDASSYVSLRMIRDTGCTLPIKLYSRDAVSDAVRSIPGVEVIPTPGPPSPSGTGWEDKQVAFADCGWRRVLYLDADAYPIADPTPMLDQLDEAGAVFWWDIPVSEDVFHLDVFGIAENDRGRMRTPQGGVILLDTVRHAAALEVIGELNRHAAYFYTATFSDQEVMRAVWTRLRLPFTGRGVVRDLVGSNHIYAHDGADGRPAFVHRTGLKFGDGWCRPNVRHDHVPGESRAWGHYAAYRNAVESVGG
ncbi:MAG: alpha-1,3-mannosyltransferase family protein [Gemmataceae bacterium]|nr:alpha-1,3-mannosyltransferase family protein [Gemmataceae bacterium]